MKLTVQELITSVKRQFGDESGVQITDDDIIRWINNGQREAVIQSETVISSTVEDSISQDNSFFNIEDYDIFNLERVYLKGIGQRYRVQYLTNEEWDLYTRNSEDTGTPLVYTRTVDSNSNEVLQFFPIPDKKYAVFIYFGKYASEVTDSSNTLVLPGYLSNYLIEYCLMKAFELDEDWDAFSLKAQQAQSILSSNYARQTWAGRDTYPNITTLPGDL